MVLIDWVSSLPPHIQPPIAQVPSAMRETMSEVVGISISSDSIPRSCAWGLGDFWSALLSGDGPELIPGGLLWDVRAVRIGYG
jgi:hypothetical protein